MGWGTELWDKETEIKTFVEDGMRTLDKVKGFAFEMSKLEASFGLQVKRLVRNFFPTSLDDVYQQDHAYRALMRCCDFIADQHEQMSLLLVNEVMEPIKNLQKLVENQRQTLYLQMSQQNAAHTIQLEILTKVQKRVDKAEKDSEIARVAFEKSELVDNNKAKTGKLRQAWQIKAKVCDAAEAELALDTEKYNRCRTAHYNVEMAGYLDKLQALNEQRSTSMVHLFGQFAKSYTTAFEKRNNLAETVHLAVQTHVAAEDSARFAQRNKSKEPIPSELSLKRREQPDYKPPNITQLSHFKTNSVDMGGANKADDEEEDEMNTSTMSATTTAATASASSSAKPAKPSGPSMAFALYDFAGENPGELKIAATDVLIVLEDDGDGWILCQRKDNTQGYVPSSYIQAVVPTMPESNSS